MKEFLIWTSFTLIIVISTMLATLLGVLISSLPGISFLAGIIFGFIGISWWIKYWNIPTI